MLQLLILLVYLLRIAPGVVRVAPRRRRPVPLEGVSPAHAASCFLPYVRRPLTPDGGGYRGCRTARLSEDTLTGTASASFASFSGRFVCLIVCYLVNLFVVLTESEVRVVARH